VRVVVVNLFRVANVACLHHRLLKNDILLLNQSRLHAFPNLSLFVFPFFSVAVVYDHRIFNSRIILSFLLRPTLLLPRPLPLQRILLALTSLKTNWRLRLFQLRHRLPRSNVRFARRCVVAFRSSVISQLL
jgi:hypothetical protein